MRTEEEAVLDINVPKTSITEVIQKNSVKGVVHLFTKPALRSTYKHQF